MKEGWTLFTLDSIKNNNANTKMNNLINSQGDKPNIYYIENINHSTDTTINNQMKGIQVKPGSSNILSFTINYSGNTVSDWSQIIGITTNSNGADQRYFGIWVCPNSTTLHIRTSTNASSNDNISDCTYRLTKGSHRIDIITNTVFQNNQYVQNYQTYDNGNQFANGTIAVQPYGNYDFPLYIYSSYGYKQQIQSGSSITNVIFASGKNIFTKSDADNLYSNPPKIN
jgi:hypothetical protein